MPSGHGSVLRVSATPQLTQKMKGAPDVLSVQSQGAGIVRPGSRRGRGEALSDWKQEQGLARPT